MGGRGAGVRRTSSSQACACWHLLQAARGNRPTLPEACTASAQPAHPPVGAAAVGAQVLAAGGGDGAVLRCCCRRRRGSRRHQPRHLRQHACVQVHNRRAHESNHLVGFLRTHRLDVRGQRRQRCAVLSQHRLQLAVRRLLLAEVGQHRVQLLVHAGAVRLPGRLASGVVGLPGRLARRQLALVRLVLPLQGADAVQQAVNRLPLRLTPNLLTHARSRGGRGDATGGQHRHQGPQQVAELAVQPGLGEACGKG